MQKQGKLTVRRYISRLVAMAMVIAGCQQTPTQTDAARSSLDLLNGDITLCGNGEFGDVSFSISCSQESQEFFGLAMSLLHSFEYEEAEKAFVKVLDADPDCAMAYWGIAMSNFHLLWIQTGTEYLEKGAKVIAVAQSKAQSPKEKDYLNAIGVFYDHWDTVSHSDRVRLFAQAMEKLYQKYPADKEAAVFFALALNASADPTDKTYGNQRKSGKILESLFPDQPNHPGIAHYIIHNYDYPELAAMALPTARRYAAIAPASAHAQHMPSHIFIRLGLWNESIESNARSTDAALCYSDRVAADSHWDEELHGMDYLVYAYLQTGDNVMANEQYDYLKKMKNIFPVNFKVAYSAAAIPARIVLENKNWKEAANLELPELDIDWSNYPWQKAIFHFARAMGSVRSGDRAGPERELATLHSLRQALVDRGDGYGANQVQIQITTIQAWSYLAEGKAEAARLSMEEAARMEYGTSKHPVTPGEVLPAGELLGDLLMATGRASQALEAYRFDLGQHPNRFNGLYGAATAARSIGDENTALQYFEMMLAQAHPSNDERKEIREAREFLRKKKAG